MSAIGGDGDTVSPLLVSSHIQEEFAIGKDRARYVPAFRAPYRRTWGMSIGSTSSENQCISDQSVDNW